MNSWDLLQLNMAFYQTVMSRAEGALARLGLEIKSFFLLQAVELCQSPAELAKHLLMPKPTVTFMLKKLERQGYVQRHSVPGDLRKFAFSVTPAGQRALRQGQAIITPALEESFNRLSPAEYATYVRLIQKMLVTG